MPRHLLAPLALVLLCALTSIQLAGCTAIGFGLGSLIDMSSGKRTPDRLTGVRTGTRITLWLRDGRKLNGRFLGTRDSLSQADPTAAQITADTLAAPVAADTPAAPVAADTPAAPVAADPSAAPHAADPPAAPNAAGPPVVRHAVLLLDTNHGIQRIPAQDVRRVSVPVARGKVIGLVTGLSFDGLMLLLLIAAASQIDFS